jgi:hypothetical protein
MDHPSRHPLATVISLFENYSQFIAAGDYAGKTMALGPSHFWQLPKFSWRQIFVLQPNHQCARL